MNTKRLLYTTFWLLLFSITACTPSPAAITDRPGLPTVVEGQDQPAEPDGADTPGGAEAALPTLAAVSDLSERLGVPAESIEVFEVEAVTWPDASLGCPEPGVFYIQILSPGYRVHLDVAGVAYIYHTDQGEQVLLCEEADVADVEDNSSNFEPGLEPLVESAKAMLGEKLGIEDSQIQVLEARSVVWPDAALGCPQPDMNYIQIPHDGALVRLLAMDTEYRYHSGGNRGLFLCETPGKTPKSSSPTAEPLLPIDPDT
ncbi:MAG: hypothetical protein R3335_01115 [Anaerolineales bacterium]|nr:hypothetical protein [Anaerolineales bacterium]